MRLIYIIFILLFSCSSRSIGPNYNKGVSHNNNLKNRSSVVMKEDKRMKRAMNIERKRSIRNKFYKTKSKSKKKYI